MDYSGLPFSKGEPRSIRKARLRKEESDALAAAYADVDLRDGGICWVTGRWTKPGAVDARMRREHNHLKGRHVKPEWVTRPERIITVCAEAHQLIHAGWIVVEGCDARKPIFFHWAAWVKSREKPFQIQALRIATP